MTAPQYISPKEAADLLLCPNPTHPYLVLDVRTSDRNHIGHFRGSLHVPVGELDMRATWLAALADSGHVFLVHCMHSQRRGPMAALKLSRIIQQRCKSPPTDQRVYIISGGFWRCWEDLRDLPAGQKLLVATGSLPGFGVPQREPDSEVPAPE
jgi:rhodanese-related sulfurtransferase